MPEYRGTSYNPPAASLGLAVGHDHQGDDDDDDLPELVDVAPSTPGNPDYVYDGDLPYPANIQGSHLVLSSRWGITDALLGECLRRRPEVSTVYLDGCFGVTNEGLRLLAAAPALASVNLARCREVTDDGLWLLAAASTLARVDLSGCWRVTDEGVRELEDATTRGG